MPSGGKSSLLLALVSCAMAVVAHPCLAGGPGPDERKLMLGRCLPSGDPCVWRCDGDGKGASCARGNEQCTYSVLGMATGELTMRIDDRNCRGNGAEFWTSLLVRRSDGSTFTTSEVYNDACGRKVRCSDSPQQPRPAFYCDAVGDYASESNRPLDSWLSFHVLPDALANQINANLPAGGTVVVADATSCGLEDHSGADDAATVKRYCVKLYFLNAPFPRTPTPCPVPSRE